ncbi:MAG: hypothetical protein J6U54_09595 [Clostridiales bacterium]|nr:hypothetical protein [Clostridiales bacterium]
MIRRYSELITIPSYEERYRYLKLDGAAVGADTFGFERFLNQEFYRSREWQNIRSQVIVRDLGCDMAFPGEEIIGKIIVHHMNPITSDDILSHNNLLIDPDYLVCVSMNTHNLIHYGVDKSPLKEEFVERKPNDTCLWRK